MTRQKAAEKVAKLERLARSSSHPAEAEGARRTAAKIAAEHGLTSRDLDVGRRSAAFDDLVDHVRRLVADKPEVRGGLFDVGPIVEQVLAAIKDVRDEDKAARLDQVRSAVKLASFVVGDHPLVSRVRTALEQVLRDHELSP